VDQGAHVLAGSAYQGTRLGRDHGPNLLDDHCPKLAQGDFEFERRHGRTRGSGRYSIAD
jgi:hypothetical protein